MDKLMSPLLYSLKQGFEALKSIRNHISEANLPADFPALNYRHCPRTLKPSYCSY
ncbi:hypothetical protein P4S54_17360 [Shewanella sp. PP-He15 brown]